MIPVVEEDSVLVEVSATVVDVELAVVETVAVVTLPVEVVVAEELVVVEATPPAHPEERRAAMSKGRNRRMLWYSPSGLSSPAKGLSR